VRWCADGEFLAIFASYISASRVQHISDLQSKFALRHIMCGSMVDIQFATAENRRRKRRKKKKKPQD